MIHWAQGRLEHDVVVDLLREPLWFRQAFHLVHRIPRDEINAETPGTQKKRDGKVRICT